MEKHEIALFERKRIAELLECLKEHGQTIKDERSKLWDSDENDAQGYSVRDRLEMLSLNVIGYLSGLDSDKFLSKEPEKVINHLHRLSIFNVECIMKWYPTAAQEYPKIKHYFELLDYIRLLTIDYIQRYRLPEPQQSEENEFTTFAS